MFERKKFKKSLFGYSKTDVSEYLNDLSEDFSNRLLEQEQKSKQEIERLQHKVDQLEADNRKLLDKHLVIANALINAEKYNSYIKEAVEMEAQKLYEDLMVKYRSESAKLTAYKQSVQQLKFTVRAMLEKISAEVDSIDKETKIVQVLEFDEVAAALDQDSEEELPEAIL